MPKARRLRRHPARSLTKSKRRSRQLRREHLCGPVPPVSVPRPGARNRVRPPPVPNNLGCGALGRDDVLCATAGASPGTLAAVRPLSLLRSSEHRRARPTTRSLPVRLRRVDHAGNPLPFQHHPDPFEGALDHGSTRRDGTSQGSPAADHQVSVLDLHRAAALFWRHRRISSGPGPCVTRGRQGDRHHQGRRRPKSRQYTLARASPPRSTSRSSTKRPRS